MFIASRFKISIYFIVLFYGYNNLFAIKIENMKFVCAIYLRQESCLSDDLLVKWVCFCYNDVFGTTRARYLLGR